jgi:RHS repeat-associated protein
MPIRSLWLTPECKQNLQLIDPHGDTVSTITTGTQPTLTAFTAFDEYGNQLNKQNPTNPATASSYGWAGKAEKPTTVSGLILMGARLYNSVTGRFTSRDPVPGGNENAYNYPNDPINGNDWTGCDGIDDFASVLTFGACFVVSFVACAVITIGASILVAISKAQDFVSANKITGLAVGIVYARAVIFAVIKSAIAIGLGRGLELFAKGPVLKLLSDQLGKFGIPVPDLGGIGKLYGSITSDRMITAVVDYLIPDIPNSGNAHLKQPKKN